uniref:Uncharacterized protein LOC104211420 n=1 Tax=Nicotiana sylvestris TaxID=4096 RepID=A0A1U7V909_NICSY|nr:PREDICTED: uncharacterized protein LOC104211420 [Nicotiana sylvestris]
MGELTFFHGLQIQQFEEGTFICQTKYTKKLIQKFGMSNAKSIGTPISPSTSLDKDEQGIPIDETKYCGMIGSLLYLTASRPDIMFSVCKCARFQSDPKESHLTAVKRIIRYLIGIVSHELWYPRSNSFKLKSFLDADLASDKEDRKSTCGIEPNNKLIEAATLFWNSEWAVVRFGDIEMTPLLEEIGGLAGLTWDSPGPLVPESRTGRGVLKIMGLKKNVDQVCLKDSYVPFEYLYERVRKDEKIQINLFMRSHTGDTLSWYIIQNPKKWDNWVSMTLEFMDGFRFNIENAPDVFYIQNLKNKPSETFREYATRWRPEATKARSSLDE